jgi:heme-degrading monooxygenase HmoA
VAVVWADLKFDYTIVEKEQIPEFERQFRNLQDADLRQEVSGLVQAYITRFKPRFG